MFHLHRHVWEILNSQVVVVADTYLKGFWQTECVTQILQLCRCGKLRVETVPYAWGLVVADHLACTPHMR